MPLSEPRDNLRFLDGLRGILCLIVVFSHCVQLYCPELRFTNSKSLYGTIEHHIANSPLNLIYNGKFPVSLFFIMSGFVISYKYNKTREDKLIINAFVKRYFRFFIPISASYIIMYFLMLIFYPYRVPVSNFIFQSIFETYFRNIKPINGVLWTISYEILGSFLIYSLLHIFGNQKNRIFFYFIAIILTIDTQYSFFIFGLIMSDFYTAGLISKNKSIKILIPSLLLSLFLSSYPIHYDMPGIYIDGIYAFVTFTKNWDLNSEIYLKLGVFLFFLTLLKSPYMQRILGNSKILFLGKISFPLYLLHYMIAQSILFTFGKPKDITSLATETFFVFLLSIALAIPFEIYIDRKGIRLSNKIAAFLLASPRLSEKLSRINI